jgi:hypothetical protein
MKKILIGIAAALFAVAAFAGFDQYASKNYKTLWAPQVIAGSAVTTNSLITGTDIAGLVGEGSVVFAYSVTNVAGATLQFQLQSCATTNGTYVTVTNGSGESSWTVTNSSGFARIKVRPNAQNRYLRVVVTPSLATNPVVGAILVTE